MTSDRASAVEAAAAVARNNGLAVADLASIGTASNVLVHLRPAPVVARVMTATAVLHPDVRGWLEQEVAVGRFLADRHAAMVPPTDLLSPGPHEHSGFWMTFWTFVEHDAARTLEPAGELGRSLGDLHRALAEFPGVLATLGSVADSLARLLNGLEPSAAVEGMRSELERLRPLAFETSLPTQALHGDVSLSNLLRTGSGLLWNDLEDTCEGPVEWDLASLVGSMRDRGADPEFVDATLEAHGAVAVDELQDFLDAQALYGRIWHAFSDQRG